MSKTMKQEGGIFLIIGGDKRNGQWSCLYTLLIIIIIVVH